MKEKLAAASIGAIVACAPVESQTVPDFAAACSRVDTLVAAAEPWLVSPVVSEEGKARLSAAIATSRSACAHGGSLEDALVAASALAAALAAMSSRTTAE